LRILLLLSFLLLFQLLDLTALLLELLLLLLNLPLSLLLLSLVVLHLVAYRESAQRAQAAADSSACARMSHGGADYRAGARPQPTADESAFLTRRQRLSGACRHEENGSQRESKDTDQPFASCEHLGRLLVIALSLSRFYPALRGQCTFHA
jgi:hypothetical protein